MHSRTYLANKYQATGQSATNKHGCEALPSHDKQVSFLEMKVSVALVTYNSERYLREQIDTIIPNLGSGDEIVISDDGSTDSTQEILNGYALSDPRFKIYQIEHSGCNGNYENAIKHCSGDIIFLSDDDNVWAGDKVAIVKKAFESDPRIGLVMHDCEVCDADLNVIAPSFFKLRNAKPGLWRNIMKVSYGGSLFAFRKELLNYILPFPKRMPVFYDEWIGTMASKHSKVVFVPQVLSKWRRHSGTQSTGYVSSEGKATTKKTISLKGSFFRLRQRISTRMVKVGWAILR